MTPTREDVESLAVALFGNAHCQKALALVDGYGGEQYKREVNRVKLEILVSSAGKSSRLAYFVKCAEIDYRDLLSGQRLGPLSPQEEAKWPSFSRPSSRDLERKIGVLKPIAQYLAAVRIRDAKPNATKSLDVRRWGDGTFGGSGLQPRYSAFYMELLNPSIVTQHFL